MQSTYWETFVIAARLQEQRLVTLAVMLAPWLYVLFLRRRWRRLDPGTVRPRGGNVVGQLVGRWVTRSHSLLVAIG